MKMEAKIEKVNLESIIDKNGIVMGISEKSFSMLFQRCLRVLIR